MYEPLLELGAETLVFVAYTAGTVALSLLGVAAEYNGLQRFHGGDQLIALWFAFMGVVAFAFAVSLTREKLLPKVAAGR